MYSQLIMEIRYSEWNGERKKTKRVICKSLTAKLLRQHTATGFTSLLFYIMCGNSKIIPTHPDLFLVSNVLFSLLVLFHIYISHCTVRRSGWKSFHDYYSQKHGIPTHAHARTTRSEKTWFENHVATNMTTMDHFYRSATTNCLIRCLRGTHGFI